MYQRNPRRNRHPRRVANNISFRDPVTMNRNRNHPFGSVTDVSNQYNRLQQLVRQQSPSSTTSSTASSSTSSSTSPPANISSLTAIPQHLQLLIQQHQQLIAAQHAHQQQQAQQHQQQAQHAHQQLLAAAAQQQQHTHSQHHSHAHGHHRHRHHRHNRLAQQAQPQQPANANDNEPDAEHKGKNMRVSAMDFDQFRVKNKATWRINWREYERRMESVEIEPQDTNKLIMDYLLCEGDYDIAMEFGKESQTETQTESDSLMSGESKITKIRSDIVASINSGNMLLAIDLILCNNYNVGGCVSDDVLLELHKQHLIELIICNKINEAFKYNLKHLLPKTKKKYNNRKLLQEIGDIMTLIACRNIKNIPQKQRNLLSLDRRQKLSNKINRILLKNDKNNKNRNESLLFENMCAINYYQNFLMNLGIKEEFDRNKINLESAIMSYNEENIKKVKERHPEFGKNNKHRSNNDAINGITNWIKLDNKYRLKVKNYLPFAVDTSKCQQFKVKSLKKYNIIHVTNGSQTK